MKPISQGTSELIWYFNECEGAMGARATPMEPSTGAKSGELPEKAESEISAAGRERPIRRALEAIGVHNARILRHAFTKTPPSFNQAVAVLGDVANVVVHAHTWEVVERHIVGLHRKDSAKASTVWLSAARAAAEASRKFALKAFDAAHRMARDTIEADRRRRVALAFGMAS